MIERLLARWERLVSERELARALASERRRAAPASPRSVFVLRNNDLGDVLVATPLFAELRRQFPAARIAVGVGPWARPLLERNPAVDEMLDVSAPWFNKFTRLGAVAALRYTRSSPEVSALRSVPFDLGIDPLGSAWGALLLVRAAIPKRFGTLGYAGGEQGFDDGLAFDPDDHVATRCARFAALAAESSDSRPASGSARGIPVESGKGGGGAHVAGARPCPCRCRARRRVARRGPRREVVACGALCGAGR